MAKNPTAVLSGRPDRTAAIGSRIFPTETIDLSANKAQSRAVNVQGLTTICARIEGDNWLTAVVTMFRSIDGVNITAFKAKVEFTSSARAIFEVDVEGAAFIIFETTTPEGGADSAARITSYGNITQVVTSSDFFLDVARGNVQGHSVLRKSGRNRDLAAGVIEDIWEQGGTFVPPTAARIHDIVSTDANDTSAGTGAQTVIVQGLDVNGLRIQEIVSMNGLTNAPTVNAYAFLTELDVVTAGNQQVNQGVITATAQVDATVSISMEANSNQDNFSITKIPSDAEGFIYSVNASALRTQGGQSGTAETFGFAQLEPLAPTLLGLLELETVAFPRGEVELKLPFRLLSNTILKISTRADTVNMDVSANFSLMLIDN